MDWPVVGQARRRLILARHGRTRWNAEGRFQGHGDPPLDAMGVAQAQRLATAVMAWRPDVLVSSDLLRTHQTAAVLSQVCGLDIIFEPGLREVDLGAWEGLLPCQAAERFPEEYRQWQEGRDPRRGGGEDPAQAGSRAAGCLRRTLRAAPDGATVLVVSHGLVLRAAMGRLAEDGMIALAGPAPHLGNGQWIVLDGAPAAAA
jgi:probable phosphoglycerate mutase